jgi:hypothetical protein
MMRARKISYVGSVGLTVVALVLSLSCSSEREFKPNGAAGGEGLDAGASGKGGGAGPDGNGGAAGLGSTDTAGGTPGAAGTDGATECSAEEKLCDGACVPIDDPRYGCDGILCSASSCPDAQGATLSCQAGVCVIDTCGDGTKQCNGTCVSVTDPAYGCGDATCDSSSCPNPGAGGSVMCQGGECVIDTCAATFKKCDNKCVSVTDPTYGCGDSTCDASTCPAPGANTLICDGGACVIGTCGADTKKCGSNCVPTDANNGCSDTARCTACAANEACGGASNTCQCVPVTMAAACAGKCGTVSNGCGGTHNCGGCTSPQTCNGGGVANVCGCTPLSKASACGAKNCGTASNGCGGNHNCGSCDSGTPVCVSGTCRECGTKADCDSSYFDCSGGACVCAPQTSVNLFTNAGLNTSLQGWAPASGAAWDSADSDDCPRSGSVALAGGSITQCVRNVTGGQNYTLGLRIVSASDTSVTCFGTFHTDTDCQDGIGPDFINFSGGSNGSSFWEAAYAIASAPSGSRSIQINCFPAGGSGVANLDQLYLAVGSGPSPSVHF